MRRVSKVDEQQLGRMRACVYESIHINKYIYTCLYIDRDTYIYIYTYGSTQGTYGFIHRCIFLHTPKPFNSDGTSADDFWQSARHIPSLVATSAESQSLSGLTGQGCHPVKASCEVWMLECAECAAKFR